MIARKTENRINYGKHPELRPHSRTNASNTLKEMIHIKQGENRAVKLTENSKVLNQNIPASTKHVLFQCYHCLVCQKEPKCPRDYNDRANCPIADFYIDYGLLKEKFPGYDWSEFIKE